MKEYDIFISYRRDGGFDLAQVIYEKLSKRGYRVFMDIESLRNGKFNKKLFSVISECTDFILILSPHALERCRNKGDWVRTEIEFAIEKKKNIIPVQAVGFTEPDNMPESVNEALTYNRLIPTYSLFNEAIDKMCHEFIQSKPDKKGSSSENQSDQMEDINRITSLLACIFLIALLVALLTHPRTVGFSPDFSFISRINQYFQENEEANIFTKIKNFYDHFAVNELLHFLSKQMMIVSAFILFILDRIFWNTTEFVKLKYKNKNFGIDLFSKNIDSFLNQLMQIERNNLISADDDEITSPVKTDIFTAERNLKNIFIASLDGEHVDYVLWKSNDKFSLFNIGEYASMSVINNLLAENEFSFVRKEKGVLLYHHEQFELRMTKPYIHYVIEIRRKTVPYSRFIPADIGEWTKQG